MELGESFRDLFVMETRKAILFITVLFAIAPWLLLFHQSRQISELHTAGGLAGQVDSEAMEEIRAERDVALARAARLQREVEELKSGEGNRDESIARLREEMAEQEQRHQEQVAELTAAVDRSAERLRGLEEDYRQALREVTRLTLERTQADRGQEEAGFFEPPSGAERRSQTIIPGPEGSSEEYADETEFDSPIFTRRQGGRRTEPQGNEGDGETVSTRGRWRVIEAGPR
jgi:hypothetical protein